MSYQDLADAIRAVGLAPYACGWGFGRLVNGLHDALIVVLEPVVGSLAVVISVALACSAGGGGKVLCRCVKYPALCCVGAWSSLLFVRYLMHGFEGVKPLFVANAVGDGVWA